MRVTLSLRNHYERVEGGRAIAVPAPKEPDIDDLLDRFLIIGTPDTVHPSAQARAGAGGHHATSTAASGSATSSTGASCAPWSSSHARSCRPSPRSRCSSAITRVVSATRGSRCRSAIARGGPGPVVRDACGATGFATLRIRESQPCGLRALAKGPLRRSRRRHPGATRPVPTARKPARRAGARLC